MDKSIEERVNAISENVSQISVSVVKLWEMQSIGQPPHKTTLSIMLAILIASVISALIGIFLAVEMYFLLSRVNAIYSLML